MGLNQTFEYGEPTGLEVAPVEEAGACAAEPSDMVCCCVICMAECDEASEWVGGELR